MAKILISTSNNGLPGSSVMAEGRAVVILAAIANTAAQWLTPSSVVITAVESGKHMKGSKHYIGNAVDVRTKNFPDERSKRDFLAAVMKRLGPGYQGIYEDPEGQNQHLHIEYDPK